MASIKAIKRRLSSVTTTRKIMKAMNMVAAAKLQKDRSRLDAARPALESGADMIRRAVHSGAAAENIYLTPQNVISAAYLVITGDRGLCGSYNINVIQHALSHIKNDRGEMILSVGSKGLEYLKRLDRYIERHYENVLETAFYQDATRIAHDILSLYRTGAIGEAYVIYTHYESSLVHRPRIERLLPIDAGQPAAGGGDISFEPDAETFINQAVPIYVGAMVYGALLHSSASEQAERMVGMDAAVTNADKIIDRLTRDYNRHRQAAVTQEISEIVSGQG